jgi:hypothetical protein
VSQQVRKRVEEIFGSKKTVGGGRKLRYIGQRRHKMWMLLTVNACNPCAAGRTWSFTWATSMA